VRIFYRESCITPKIEANRLKFNRTAENQWFGQHKYDLRKLNLPGKVKKGQASVTGQVFWRIFGQ
jgi:hypothetical protein